MRLATFDHYGKRLSGAVVGDTVHAFPEGTDLLDLIRRGSQALWDCAAATPAGGVYALSDVTLLAPFLPPTVRDFMTFEGHVEGIARGFGDSVPEEWYAEPVFYFTNPYSVIGTGADVPVPPGCELFDFEVEVAAVIGRGGSDLTPEQAREHIIGYTLLNDWSARDLQGREMRVKLGPSKGKDSSTTLGPWLVTPDDLEAYRTPEGFLDLELVVEVNGTKVGGDTLANMAWTFEEMTAHASRGTTVRPGDVLGSGTCGGGGCLAELWGRSGRHDPPPLRPGDTVTITATGLGAITNTVVQGRSPVPVRPARRRP
ncbi:fumarylacetoacetate hydrolase family protein [Streptomyces sp. NBC_00631]|uniref:fumarylacetoacetate hydrolase family protein n=1 Tax=Streptomyces sp. NBC_00631 TaxID=2975793 RepID=UPI0030DFC28A